MKPIRVALFHRADWYRGPPRIDGFFQYPVPEFEWEHFEVTKRFNIDLFDYEGFDIAWLDDGKYKDNSSFSPLAPRYTYGCPPVVMYILYPTLTAGHYKRRVARAAGADLILVDHDRLDRWQRLAPVHRLAYCTNEFLYRDRGERDIDVGFYCVYAWNKERPALDAWLQDYCHDQGWVYRSTYGKNVGLKYAELLARTKVVVHMNRTPLTRPPRIFDVAASGSCLLSNPMPEVSGEHFEPGVHYWPFHSPASKEYKQWKTPPRYADCIEIREALHKLLDERRWKSIAENAQAMVLKKHTWRHRAKELRTILLDVFPKLRRNR